MLIKIIDSIPHQHANLNKTDATGGFRPRLAPGGGALAANDRARATLRRHWRPSPGYENELTTQVEKNTKLKRTMLV